MIVRKSPFILVMALLAQACFSQDSPGTEKLPRRLLVSLDAAAETGYTAQDKAVLGKSLALALREAAQEFSVVEYGTGDFPPSPEARNGEAERLVADSWLWVEISGSRGSPSIRVQSYDLLTQTMTIDQEFTRDREIDPLEASHEHWREIVSLVLEKYHSIDASQVTKNERRTVRLLIRALPDTRITGLPGEPLVASKYGVATASLEAPSSYHLRATLDGYYPAQKDVYVDADAEVQIVQRPGAVWSVEGSFFNAFFLGGDLGYYFLPDTAFLKVGVTSFLLGLAFEQESLLFSYPLVHVNLQVGRYWGAEDAGVRLYTAVGGFVRIVSIPGSPIRIDALSQGGFQLNLGAEIPIMGKSRVFFEYIPMLYLSDYPELFLETMGSSNVPFGFLPVIIGAFDFMNVRFGVRWML